MNIRSVNFKIGKCLSCGKEFQFVNYMYNRKYCGHECAYSHRRLRTWDRNSKVCEHCGKKFSYVQGDETGKRPRDRSGTGDRFCSRKCFLSFFNNKLKKNRCKICGKEYPKWDKCHNKKFCSVKCWNANQRKLVGPEMYNYKNGVATGENKKYHGAVRWFCSKLGIRPDSLPEELLNIIIQLVKTKKEVLAWMPRR